MYKYGSFFNSASRTSLHNSILNNSNKETADIAKEETLSLLMDIEKIYEAESISIDIDNARMIYIADDVIRIILSFLLDKENIWESTYLRLISVQFNSVYENLLCQVFEEPFVFYEFLFKAMVNKIIPEYHENFAACNLALAYMNYELAIDANKSKFKTKLKELSTPNQDMLKLVDKIILHSMLNVDSSMQDIIEKANEYLRYYLCFTFLPFVLSLIVGLSGIKVCSLFNDTSKICEGITSLFSYMPIVLGLITFLFLVPSCMSLVVNIPKILAWNLPEVISDRLCKDPSDFILSFYEKNDVNNYHRFLFDWLNEYLPIEKLQIQFEVLLKTFNLSKQRAWSERFKKYKKFVVESKFGQNQELYLIDIIKNVLVNNIQSDSFFIDENELDYKLLRNDKVYSSSFDELAMIIYKYITSFMEYEKKSSTVPERPMSVSCRF